MNAPDRYDPQVNDALLWQRPVRTLLRLIQLAWATWAFAFMIWVDRQPWLPHRFDRIENQRRRARWLANKLISLGSTFIKVGQVLSIRPDLLPLPYTKELAKLQDRVPPFPSAIALQMVERELGRPLSELFSSIDAEPFSAASIGQVYGAKLLSGEEVIVKVQRPNLRASMALDLAILRRVAAWVERLPSLARGMPWVQILDRFGIILIEQTHFEQEAINVETFRSNFLGFPGVRAPRVYLVSRHVLVEERVWGYKFDDLDQITASGIDFRKVAANGVRSLIKQLIEDGFFHADIHPGNVFVCPPAGEIVYIDFGMVDRVEPELQLKMVDMFLHMVNLNFAAFIEDLIDLEFLPKQVDRTLILPIITDVYETQLGLRGKKYSLQEVLDRLSGVLYEYPFRIPEKFAFIMRTVGMMEGVVLSIHPDFKFLDVALPYAGKLLLTEHKRELRDRLVEALFAGDRLELPRFSKLFGQALLEPTFQVGEFARLGIDYLTSADGERVLYGLTDALLEPPVTAGGGTSSELVPIAQRVLLDPSLDPEELVRPILRFLATPAGARWVQHAIARARAAFPGGAAMPDISALAPAMLAFLGRLDGGMLVDETLSTARALLAEPGVDPQVLVDLLTALLRERLGRHLAGALGSRLQATDGNLMARARAVLPLLEVLQTRGVNTTPLWGELFALLASEEGKPWRAAMLALFRTERLWELVKSLPPALRHLVSDQGGGTWEHFFGLVRSKSADWGARLWRALIG